MLQYSMDRVDRQNYSALSIEQDYLTGHHNYEDEIDVHKRFFFFCFYLKRLPASFTVEMSLSE